MFVAVPTPFFPLFPFFFGSSGGHCAATERDECKGRSNVPGCWLEVLLFFLTSFCRLQARRQKYSAKIALMTAKLQALPSPSSVVFLCFTQDTDGKLDLSTELARERKAQVADL